MSEQNDRKTVNTNMLHRILIIHQLIKSGSYPNRERIRDKITDVLGVDRPSTATFSRDMNVLRDVFKADIAYSKEYGGYYYTDKNFNLPLNNLKGDELFYLTCAKTLLKNLKGTPLYEEISTAIAFVVDSSASPSGDLLSRIAVAPSPQVLIDEGTWQVLKQALMRCEIVEFVYSGHWNEEKKPRRVHPYQIILNEGMYYLWGYDELASPAGTRLFCFPRIENPHTTGAFFELPADFEYEKHTGGGKMGVWADINVSTYRVAFFGLAKNFVRDYIWGEDQTVSENPADDSIIISFRSAQWQRVKQWVLSQGASARPLEPAWLVKAWQEEIRQMSARAELPN